MHELYLSSMFRTRYTYFEHGAPRFFKTRKVITLLVRFKLGCWYNKQRHRARSIAAKTMAEPAQQQLQQQQQDAPQQEAQQTDQRPPPLEMEAPAMNAQEDGQARGRNEVLEVALRRALEGSPKDLGGLCKTLGEAFCLPSSVPPRVAGYDSGSDTTAPADQEQSSSSESGAGSETGGDGGSGNAAIMPTGASGSASSGRGAGAAGGKEVDRSVRALADAAEVSMSRLSCIVVFEINRTRPLASWKYSNITLFYYHTVCLSSFFVVYFWVIR